MKASETESLPWWVFMAIAFIAVEYHMVQKPSGDVFEFEAPAVRARVGHGLSLRVETARRLSEGGHSKSHTDGDDHADKLKKQMKRRLKKKTLYIQVPCMMKLIQPCGNVSVGAKGVVFSTPFGEQRLPGPSELGPQVEQTEDFMSDWTVYIVAGLSILYVVKKLTIDRVEVTQNMKEILAGSLGENDGLSPEEQAEQLADKMDPKTDGFIAPGNIYRCLAVLHPGYIGYSKWVQLALKALISSYMQLFIPYKIIRSSLDEWQMLGVKSPLWFMSNASTFASMMAALLSLCNMFAGKCVMNILNGAEANFYILSHKKPATPGPDYAAVASNPDDAAPRNPSPTPDLPPLPTPPGWLIAGNEYVWCCLSQVVNIGMSFLLQLAMFVKVATFTGQVGEVAVVAVSLYFVFDLDTKVLDAEPKLKTKYRKAVLEQTAVRSYQPVWMNSFAMASVFVLQTAVPFGLLGIILCSWKNGDGIVIGGDGITRK